LVNHTVKLTIKLLKEFEMAQKLGVIKIENYYNLASSCSKEPESNLPWNKYKNPTGNYSN